MKVMREIYILITIFAVLGILYYYRKKRIEGLDIEPESKKLINPMQLAATVFRASNTILTSAGVYSSTLDKLPLPDSIKDSYNEWIEKGFVSSVKDQMLCGGCWAFATCSSLTDRITIATNGKWKPDYGLSEQILISCGGEMGMDYYQGCEGGIPQFAINALSKTGLPLDSKCLECGNPPEGSGSKSSGRSGGVVNPNNTSTCAAGGNNYAATDYTWWQTGCDGTSSCNLTAASTCPCAGITAAMNSVDNDAVTPFEVKYKTIDQAHNYTTHGKNHKMHTVDLWPDIPQDIINENVIRMKKAIYYEGPLTVGFRVTQDFYTYWPTASDKNYYKYDGTSPMAGGHAVVLVGWKKMDDGTPVWIAKNSWGVNGGYGFPDGPKIVNSKGETVPKYLGGFWNHVMGINDSFIESNASGALPDLDIPEIQKHMPNNGKDIPKEWHKTMTLRQIYESHDNTVPPTSPDSQPIPPTSPDSQPIPPTNITTNKFLPVTLTPDNITPASIMVFFNDTNNLYMIGSNDVESINKIISYLPDNGQLTEDNVKTLVENMRSNVNTYVVLAIPGDMNNYYTLYGNPIDWDSMFNKTFITRSATLKKFANDAYFKFQGLRLQAPIVQLSKKIEGFQYRWI